MNLSVSRPSIRTFLMGTVLLSVGLEGIGPRRSGGTLGEKNEPYHYTGFVQLYWVDKCIVIKVSKDKIKFQYSLQTSTST